MRGRTIARSTIIVVFRLRATGLRSGSNNFTDAPHLLDRSRWTSAGFFAIAQTPDGILWIDSFAGLFTFDGVKFDMFRQKLGSTALSGGTLGYLFVSNEGIVGTGLPKAAVLL